MRKYYFILIVICFGMNLKAQIVYIPDANFKAKLLLANPDNPIAYDLNGNYFTIDNNNDNEIQVSEALNVSALHISGSGIEFLTGIQDFINLKELDCSSNQITAINGNDLNNLLILNCDYNQLSTFNTVGFYSLQNLWCRDNGMSALTLDGLNNLQILNCDYNQITTLNLSGLSNLQTAHCSYNQLNTLNILGSISLIDLYCDYNNLTSLNANGLVNLIFLSCMYNHLNTLMVDNLTNLQMLECRHNNLTTMNLSDSFNMTFLGCRYNLLTSLFIKNGANESLDAQNNYNLAYVCCDDFQTGAIQSRVSQYPNCVVTNTCNLGIAEVAKPTKQIAVYPNPANHFLTIETNGIIRNGSIYNMLEQLVLEFKTSDIDISALTSGNYLIKLSTDSGNFYTRFVKE